MQNPYYAYGYAYFIDKESRENTRNAACKDFRYAYFMRDIDKRPREDTREAACKDPENAYYYAKHGQRTKRRY